MRSLNYHLYALAFLTGITCCRPFKAHSQEKQAYLFSYFTGNGEDGLHLAYSLDDYVWKPLNNGSSLLEPQVDENIIQKLLARNED